jgi:Rrf2 family cysteine metabolism transcriptional repressor
MKLSTRTRYGIRAILELAQNQGREPLQIRIIAQRQDISVKYLEQVMTILRSAGFVRSIRGSKGGYILAKPPEKIKISQLFDCLEGDMITVECVEDKDYCKKTSDCVARLVWAQVQKAINDVLKSITLQEKILVVV